MGTKQYLVYLLAAFFLVSCTAVSPTTPTATAVPTPTTAATAMAVPLELAVLALPTSAWAPTLAIEPITPDNLDRLKELVAIDQGAVCTAVFSPDGQWLAASGSENITLWHLTDDWVSTTLATGFPGVREIVFDTDATFLATSTLEQVRVRDMASGDLLWQLLDDFEHEVGGVALSSDGTLVAAGTGCVFNVPGTAFVKVWDTASGTLLLDIPMPSFIMDVAFSPDGTLLAATSGDGIIRLWDVVTGDLYAELHGHTGGVSSIAFSPDGTQLLSLGDYDEVRLWDVVSGEQLFQFEGTVAGIVVVAFSADGRLVVAGGGSHTFTFWDTLTGTEVTTRDTGIKGNYIYSVAVNASNTLLATCGHDETLRLWGVPVSGQ